MKHANFTFILIFLYSISLQSQSLDTLVDVGGYNLHFNIIKGEGIPILFEAGGGNDGSVWNNILDPISKVTGTTLITYDRSGFGKSAVNSKETDDSKFGIVNGMEELETGLKKLGYDGNIILVSHSYGGFYTTLYAARHPEKVKYVVMVDALNGSFWTDELINKYLPVPVEKNEENLGIYYLRTNYQKTVQIMRQTVFPGTIPVMDLIAGIPFTWMTEEEWREWDISHKNFVNDQPNRKGIKAYGSAHYIFTDNPALVINTIVNAYSETLDEEQRCDILKQGLDNAIELSIEAKKKEMEYLHSEIDFNQWGYSLMQSGELEKALEVFKLNVFLFPESWKVYDSYGKALLKSNRKEEAIEMYEKSIELNPDNENGRKMLEKIKLD
ncbi:alpha/beta fold hydrolase [bacterium]|nr:alpha/beta fold hydrolase [bacterium]